MPWFRLDDSFHSHPKVIAAGNEAVGLYVRCGTYCAQHLTEGFIPEQVLLLYGSSELAETLVRTKLLRRVRGGWRMPDYLLYNPSARQVADERKAKNERQKRWREAKGRRNVDASTEASRDASQDGAPTPAPPRPEGSGAGGAAPGQASANGRASPTGSPARAPRSAGRVPPLPPGQHQHPFIPGSGGLCAACQYPQPNRRHFDTAKESTS